MNAPVDLAKQRDERRCQASLSSLQSDLLSLAHDIERARDRSFGESAAVILSVQDALDIAHQKAGRLRAEFIELAKLARELERASAHEEEQGQAHGNE